MINKTDIVNKIRSLVKNGDLELGVVEATSVHNGVDYELPIRVYCATESDAIAIKQAIQQEPYFVDHEIHVSPLGIKEDRVYDQYILALIFFWYIPDSEDLRLYKTVAGLSVLSEATERGLDELETKIWGSVKKRFRNFPRLIHRDQE